MNADNGNQTSVAQSGLKQQTYMTALLLFILLVALILRGWDIRAMWQDDARGWAGAFYSHVAKNYLTFGFAATKGAMVRTVNPRNPSEFVYYMDHPPMIGWLLAGSFGIFGYHEWSNRLVGLLCSMGSLITLYFIAKRACGLKAALGMLALVSVLPMGVFYGGFVDVQGPVVFFFCMLTVLAYQRFAERPTRLNTGGMLGAFFFGALTDWPAYYLVPIFLVHYFLTTGRRSWRILLLPSLAVLAGAGFLLHQNYVLTGAPSLNIDVMLGAFLHRAGSAATDSSTGAAMRHFTTEDWFNTVVFTAWPKFFTLPCLLLSGVWVLVVLVKIVARRLSRAEHFFLIFLIFGAIHVLLFRQGASVHNYWSYYLLPAVALGCVMPVFALGRLFPRRWDSVRAVFAPVAVCALVVWPVVQSIELAKQTKYEYSQMGAMLAEWINPRELLLNDFEAHFGMDFYLRNPVQFAYVCPANMQLMSQRKDIHHFFFSNLFSSYKGKVFGALPAMETRWDFGKGYLVDMRNFNYAACKPEIEPPEIVKAYWEGDRFHLQWCHPHPEKVAHYRIYSRPENVPFYRSYADVKGTELSEVMPGYRRDVVVIVAVGADGEESGFSTEIPFRHE